MNSSPLFSILGRRSELNYKLFREFLIDPIRVVYEIQDKNGVDRDLKQVPVEYYII